MSKSGKKSIIVSGAGPVGLAAALELARRGFAPRIVDKADGPAPLTESRALAVNPRTLALLEPSGASEEIIAAAQHIREMRIRSRDKRLVMLDLTAMEGRYKGIRGLAQGRTERILIERLAAFGIAPERQTELTLTGTDPAKPEVMLRHADGREETARPDILIVAEGAHSEARHALGIGFPGESVKHAFYLADFRYDRAIDTGHGEAVFFNPGVFARLPVAADTLRYISTMPNFTDLIDHPASVVETPWKTDFHVSFRHVDPMSKGNIFLAGDAAHIHSPVGGRGMNLGIEDACWLAFLISEGREADYSGLRTATARTVLSKTQQMTRMILLANPLAIAARNALMPLALNMPAIRRKAILSVAGLDTPAPPWL
ncbi:MAG TPA: FAD-dependent monooxygenase [Pararhizobium sp.]|nr:FAD-dependent monooxygenase [Pararhizobium sp.]